MGVGVLDEIKAILSPAGAWLWAELGNRENHRVHDTDGGEERQEGLKIII